MRFKTKLIFVFFIFLIFILFGVAGAVSNSTNVKSTTFTVVEGDIVKLKPSVSDLDQDKVFVYYFSPLNKSGEWQTDLKDAGTYQTKILISDGRNEVEEKVTLVVKNKNQAPTLKDKSLIYQEGDKIDLKKLISDPDKDKLKMSFEKPFNQEGVWQTTYANAGKHNVLVTFADSEFTIKETIAIVIKNKNAPPEISSFSPKQKVLGVEGQTIKFQVKATDFDKDELNYLWQVDGKNFSQEASGSYYFDFSSAGKHKVLIKVTDGQADLFKLWDVLINNTNRAPVLNLLSPVTIKEGEKLTLKLPTKDKDGDAIKYTFSSPLQKGFWQTNYNDAGNYTIEVKVTDGGFVTSQNITIVVQDVDRAPVIKFQEIAVKEGQDLKLNLTQLIVDPDGGKVFIKASLLPAGAKLNKGVLEWKPSHTFIQRRVNFLTNFLSRIKLEKLIFAQSKKVKIPISACGKILCTNKTLELKVTNVNQKPVLQQMKDVVVWETKKISLKPIASDTDKDVLKYRYGKPFNSKGEWKPGYSDSGNYTIEVMVSDGYSSATKQVNVLVKNKNRPPTFKIKKDYFKLNEKQAFSMKVTANDVDGDKLNLSVAELPRGASFKNQVFSWTPDYDVVTERKPGFWNNFYAKSDFLNRRFGKEYKQLGIDFVASDGDFKVVHPVLLTVKNVNRPPKIVNYFPVVNLQGKVGEEIVFHANVSDLDGDKLTYEWDFGVWDEGVIDGPVMGRTFVDSGLKTVKVKVGDGTYFTEQEWGVRIVAPVVEKSVPLALSEVKKEEVEKKEVKKVELVKKVEPKKVEPVKPVEKVLSVKKEVVKSVMQPQVVVQPKAVVPQVIAEPEEQTYIQYVIDVPAEEVNQPVVKIQPVKVEPQVNVQPQVVVEPEEHNYVQYVIDVPPEEPTQVEVVTPVVEVVEPQLLQEVVQDGGPRMVSYVVEH